MHTQQAGTPAATTSRGKLAATHLTPLGLHDCAASVFVSPAGADEDEDDVTPRGGGSEVTHSLALGARVGARVLCGLPTWRSGTAQDDSMLDDEFDVEPLEFDVGERAASGLRAASSADTPCLGGAGLLAPPLAPRKGANGAPSRVQARRCASPPTWLLTVTPSTFL